MAIEYSRSDYNMYYAGTYMIWGNGKASEVVYVECIELSENEAFSITSTKGRIKFSELEPLYLENGYINKEIRGTILYIASPSRHYKKSMTFNANAIDEACRMLKERLFGHVWTLKDTISRLVNTGARNDSWAFGRSYRFCLEKNAKYKDFLLSYMGTKVGSVDHGAKVTFFSEAPDFIIDRFRKETGVTNVEIK